jgi:hypothetical protein
LNFLTEKSIDFNILNDLNGLNNEEKTSVALSLSRDLFDLKLLNEAINKGTLSINNFIKRMVVKYA